MIARGYKIAQMITRRKLNASSGFTLLETAVVVVLAGFLVSGILKGQELVGNARAKSIINDLNGVNSASLAYFDRYKAWPGDDSNAGGVNGRWSVFGAKNGNGNGVIGGKYHDPAPPGDPAANLVIGANGEGESINFWWHLRISGFASGPLSGPGAAAQPIMPSGGVMGVQTGEPALAAANFFSGLVACVSNVSERIAVTIDSQLDDQLANHGYVRGLRQPNDGTFNPPLAATDGTLSTYIEDGNSRYVMCRAMQ